MDSEAGQMKHCQKEAQCLTRVDFKGDGKHSGDRYTRLLVFDGWSVEADHELHVDASSEVPVFFDGDQGTLRKAPVSKIDMFLKEDAFDFEEEVLVDLYFSPHKNSVFLRNIGKEESFWFPSPTYIFDTETDLLLSANSIEFDPDMFIDGVIVTEESIPEGEKVCNIKNVYTGATKIFNLERFEELLGSRFHALKMIRGLEY